MKTTVHEESFGIIPLRRNGDHWQVLLILHHGGRHWAFPKGHGNPGETALESAKRELNEETGLEVEKLLQETPLTEKYQFYRKHEIVVKTVRYFPALVFGNLRLQAEEIKAAKWVLLKEATDHLTFQESKQMCKKVQDVLEKT